MLKTLVVGAGTALVLMTSNAGADGMPTPKAKPVVACCFPNWTGFYVGLGVGGAFATHEHSAKDVYEQQYYDYTVVDVSRLWNLDNGRSHAFGTVTMGYDHLFGHWVGGVFADYDFGGRNGDTRFADAGPIYDVRLSPGHGHTWSVGGRLGFLANPATLLFLSGGWTQVTGDGDLSFWFDGNQYKRSFGGDRGGWFVGAGIETQLAWLHSGLFLRGEYRFTRLDDDNGRFSIGEGYECYECNATRRLEFKDDTDVHSVRVVLGYKFGRVEPAPLK